MCTYWDKKIELHNYVQVQTPGRISYGGDQKWFASQQKDRRESVLSDYGCGLVALGDFFLMAGRRFPALVPSMDNRCFRPVISGKTEDVPVEKKRYLAYLHSLGKGYITIFPRVGVNAWQMWLAMWRYLRKSGQKGRIYWGVLPGNFLKRTASMLEQGLPVPFCVGPNLNLFRRDAQVPMYQMREGKLQEVCRIRGHYMNITGLFWDSAHELYFQVSSWGKCYYISWKEFEAYRKLQPPIWRNWLSNLLYVKLK
ncbi:MAG: hypothetical protein ACOYBE_04990 [Blautia sp.]|jgi:hypothetical protein